MASPAAVLSVLVRAHTSGTTEALALRFNQQLGAATVPITPPTKTGDPDRPPNRAERRKPVTR